MDAAAVTDIVREGVGVILRLSGPLLLVALVVGVGIAVFQALTQVQEMTITFVPKIFAIFLCLIVVFPYMITTMVNFTEQTYSRMTQLE